MQCSAAAINLASGVAYSALRTDNGGRCLSTNLVDLQADKDALGRAPVGWVLLAPVPESVSRVDVFMGSWIVQDVQKKVTQSNRKGSAELDLDASVLFATDKATLTKAADAVITAAGCGGGHSLGTEDPQGNPGHRCRQGRDRTHRRQRQRAGPSPEPPRDDHPAPVRPTMTRCRPAAIAGAALAATLLGGCSFEPGTPDPTTSRSASGAAGASPSVSASSTPQDQSAAVVGAAAPLTAIATTRARPDSSFAGATFTFYRLTRTGASTLLVWRVAGGTGYSSPRDANVRAWENYPVMVAGGKKYAIVTFVKQDDGWSALSNPILSVDSGQEAPPQSALYPPLPAGTTEVTLTGPWFADVTVPVTDLAATG